MYVLWIMKNYFQHWVPQTTSTSFCDLIILWKHFESDSHVPHSLHAVVEKKESQENRSRTSYQRESWWQHHSEETQNRITQTQEK